MNEVSAVSPVSETSYGSSAGIVGSLNVFGAILKTTPRFPDWAIPFALMLCGAVAKCLVDGFSGPNIFEGIVLGLLAVSLNSVYRQSREAIASAKNAVSGILLALGLGLATTGCVAPQSPESTAARIEGVARLATREALIERPDWKEDFALAASHLAFLETAETISVDDVIHVVQSLKIKELKSRTARIVFDTGRIVFIDYTSRLEFRNGTSLRPIVAAIRKGIEKGMGEASAFNADRIQSRDPITISGGRTHPAVNRMGTADAWERPVMG